MTIRAGVRVGVHSGQHVGDARDFLEFAERCESLNFDFVSDFDHFRPPDGTTSSPCLEGLTLISAVAARTQRIRCSTLVVGVIYRHPALLASMAATIDSISGGRFELGLGATWHDGAQPEYGITLPPLRTRIEMLEETCRVVRSLWENDSTSFVGKYFELSDAHLEPKPVQDRIPLIIGGSEEKRLLRVVAEHADIWNTAVADLDVYEHKSAVVDAHCRDVGRAPDSLRRSVLFRALLAESESDAKQRLDEVLPPGAPTRPSTFCGTPEQLIETLEQYLGRGVQDFLLNARPPYDWETIELLSTVVAPALKSGS